MRKACGSSTACWTASGEHLGGRLCSEDVVDPSIKGLRIDARFDASPLRLRQHEARTHEEAEERFAFGLDLPLDFPLGLPLGPASRQAWG